MSCLEIEGGTAIRGEIVVQGSKNAVLPILAGCIPGEGECVIENCPRIQDVEDTLMMLRSLGAVTVREGTSVRVDCSDLAYYEPEGQLASGIRSSVLFLGALIGKIKKAVLPFPGGCAIGSRPIDLHLEILKKMGADFILDERIRAGTGGLTGCQIRLRFPSVGATENAILAAVQAEGDTCIYNAAIEPEISELCKFLNLRGAKIRRKKDGSILICGGYPLGPVRYRVGADRIAAGTYLLAAQASCGEITVHGTDGKELRCVLDVMEQMGAEIIRGEEKVSLRSCKKRALPFLATAPYPGFPTDLQSPLMAALCTAEGTSRIRETIFENRFCTVNQLNRMGARISHGNDEAVIHGVNRLYGARVTAPDLRGGAALVLAALQAEGVTRIDRAEYIGRGYETICENLMHLGAKIRKL